MLTNILVSGQASVTKRKSRGSTADDEEEHPYELLLTAETKKHIALDKKTKGKRTCHELVEAI